MIRGRGDEWEGVNCQEQWVNRLAGRFRDPGQFEEEDVENLREKEVVREHIHIQTLFN